MSKTLKEKWESWETDDEKVRDFQRKIYRKAKQEPEYRFYILYDKVSLPYMLREALRRCAVNHGSPGIDGQTCIDITEGKVSGNASSIAKEPLSYW